MTIDRRSALKGPIATPLALAAAGFAPAAAQGRRETLLLVSEDPPNSTDIHGVGVNRPAHEARRNLYDRLMTFGVKKGANGNDHHEHEKLEPELAEGWDLRPMSVTVKLRRNAPSMSSSATT